MSSSMWDARYAGAQVWDLEPNRLVLEALDHLSPGRALDVGAGEGRHALWLASKGWQVTAVDFSSVAVGKIQARAALMGLEVDAQVGDVTRFRPRHDFDLVLFSYLHLVMPSLKRALRTAVAVLTEGGEFFLVAHDASNLDRGYGGPPDPDVLTTPEAVADILTATGLEVTRAEVVARQVHTESGTRTALDHVVQAVRRTG